jgi:hypothetical protein
MRDEGRGVEQRNQLSASSTRKETKMKISFIYDAVQWSNTVDTWYVVNKV